MPATDFLSQLEDYRYGFHDPELFVYKAPKGLTADVIKRISQEKSEPSWMLEFRLQAFELFKRKSMPSWGANLSGIDFASIHYYLKPTASPARSWDDVPQAIKRTYERLGIPQAERELLGGVKAQYDSEVVYGSLLEDLRKKGVIFLSMDEGLREYPDLVRKFFGTLVPPSDNKFAALNSAVWSGGSFVYVPKGVKVELPLQAYFRINAANIGQFERTLIIVEEGAEVSYVEGCTAPVYSTESLHAAVVEIFVGRGAKVRYTTIQNWSKNVYNLVTKRSRVEAEGIMSWVDCNLGSKVTMKYPSSYLVGPKAYGEVLSMAYAGQNQHQDTGGKMLHLASETSSQIISKSISACGGRTSYRGLIHIPRSSQNVKTKVTCDALILDSHSRSDTYPTMKVDNSNVQVEHEATVSRLGERQLFYLSSRGFSQNDASTLIVSGFVEPIVKHLPMEYAVEMNRLLELEMEGSVG